MKIFNFFTFHSRKLILSLCIMSSIHIQGFAKGFPNEYYEISNINDAKNYFFNHMYEIISMQNNKIQDERRLISSILLNKNILNIDFDSTTFIKLLEIKQKYKIRNLYTVQEYLKKIDIIPPSLAIAQAAVESAWGKSRFTKEASNIFGHWTYNREIGLMPKKRALGSSHFIRIFKNIKESTEAYMLNLNRNLAYKSFQEKRFEQRKNNIRPDGLLLSETMINYSGIAHDYLILLKEIILSNNLQVYDQKYYAQYY